MASAKTSPPSQQSIVIPSRELAREGRGRVKRGEDIVRPRHATSIPGSIRASYSPRSPSCPGSCPLPGKTGNGKKGKRRVYLSFAKPKCGSPDPTSFGFEDNEQKFVYPRRVRAERRGHGRREHGEARSEQARRATFSREKRSPRGRARSCALSQVR